MATDTLDPRARRNIETVRTFLRLLEEGNIGAWIELWAPHADHYYPFGTDMFPAHLNGKPAVYDRWKDTPSMFDSMRFPLGETWVDGDTVIARFTGECVLKGGGKTYTNDYLAVFAFDSGGLIRRYWEYFDPIRAGVGFGLADVQYKAPS
jgi:ketosteroid isomerase-like protein